MFSEKGLPVCFHAGGIVQLTFFGSDISFGNFLAAMYSYKMFMELLVDFWVFFTFLSSNILSFSSFVVHPNLDKFTLKLLLSILFGKCQNSVSTGRKSQYLQYIPIRLLRRLAVATGGVYTLYAR